MRFCQADGTPLVPDAEPTDPYKTMVARRDDIAAAIPPAPAKEEEVLQLPDEPDPLKTMYASEDEIRSAMSDDKKDEVIEIPPLAPPEPPKFSEPSLSPPPSPFSPEASPGKKDHVTTPPIPSPFSEPKLAPKKPEFKEPEPAFQAASSPFDATPAAASQAEWTPPPAPVSNTPNTPMQQQNPSMPPPPGAAAGQSKVLAIVSLVLGILSLLCCNWFIVGLAAVITGFIAKSKASGNPNEYGGAGLALGGIIAGVISMLLGVVIWVLYFFGFLAGIIGNMGGQF